MQILAYNCGHDGSAAMLDHEQLRFCIESEKDDGPRHMWAVTPSVFVRSLQINEPPDVVALSGFHRQGWFDARITNPVRDNVEAGYFDEGCEGKIQGDTLFVGRTIRRFSSSHVRSHIMCSYGLAPFPQGQPCYALIWEGHIGAMYYIDEHVAIRQIGEVLLGPGARYDFLYWLANPSARTNEEFAGKVMALAAYGRRGAPTTEEQEFIDFLFRAAIFSVRWTEANYGSNRYFNIGVESQAFKDLAWQCSAALFDRFYAFAQEHVMPGLPLIIGGGCGLNCDWNSQWRESGLFADVFVPPCTNDSGVAIGAAVDALHHYSGRAKIAWNVYAGDEFLEDAADTSGYSCSALNLADVCRCLLNGDVIAWVQGRCEMGPRALGNRSLLAAPFSTETRDKLNRLKQREGFRPVAPICLEEDFGCHFEPSSPSPYMLYFQRVKSSHLAAVTHVDGSARGQSVNERENPEICALLREFKAQSGVAVLCNTSLNFKAHGFINRLSHLFLFARECGIEGVVVGRRFWRLCRRVDD